jgi:hypothetical protein
MEVNSPVTNNAVDVVHVPRIRARPHRDHPARFHHLFVKPLNDGRHFQQDRPGDDHQICFPRRAPYHFGAEPGNVKLAYYAGCHLHVAAGESEVEGPYRVLAAIETIPSRAMEVFAAYAWPGNVRELQNFIERAVILSPGAVLRPPLSELKQAPQEPNSRLSTLEEAERNHVLRALRESSWVIGGSNGAAARLGVKRTTLAYRIRKLKVSCRPQ